MLVECVNEFHDNAEGVARPKGQRFEVSDERFQEINGAGFGVLVSAVEEKPEGTDEQPEEEPEKPKRGRAAKAEE